MYELVYVLKDHFHILVKYCMDLWEINDDDERAERTTSTFAYSSNSKTGIYETCSSGT
jgi:hypothetical protein